jgi:hypothetical protein
MSYSDYDRQRFYYVLLYHLHNQIELNAILSH